MAHNRAGNASGAQCSSSAGSLGKQDAPAPNRTCTRRVPGQKSTSKLPVSSVLVAADCTTDVLRCRPKSTISSRSSYTSTKFFLYFGLARAFTALSPTSSRHLLGVYSCADSPVLMLSSLSIPQKSLKTWHSSPWCSRSLSTRLQGPSPSS